jgi:hypothetical protein
MARTEGVLILELGSHGGWEWRAGEICGVDLVVVV